MHLKSFIVGLRLFFFLNDPAPPEISPLSLPDALPISLEELEDLELHEDMTLPEAQPVPPNPVPRPEPPLPLPQPEPAPGPGSGSGSGTGPGAGDRKSTRLNSSHGYISYAVFCLKKKNN